MFKAIIVNEEAGRVAKYRVIRNGSPLTYANVLDLWSTDFTFREYFTSLLAASPFTAYRWETPALNIGTVDNEFEFVLINSPSLCNRKTDAATYKKYFTNKEKNGGIVTFANLGGDATLIVPSPRTDANAYGHLAAFLRQAPAEQHDAFWKVLGGTVKFMLDKNSIWVSTAGGGVAWLHARVDNQPKYYAYSPFKTA
ncbi:DUF6940 family protein [Leucothrix arctica]|uniref:Uncharacterized protein n=1 Tax=Leucothrix arctica TaxID=1481894 RepID=A0A317CFD8_9GAMM|nr:hypothetical protein [Leucothrix arctica]PWQ96791.1 hypothetical protein DKT75_08465 [Leucothrix arctica]